MKIGIEHIAYVIAIVAVFTFGVVGTYLIGNGGGFNIKSMSPLAAAYFTIVTMSTVGYGDIYPVSSMARIFVMVLIVLGLSIFLSAITIISSGFVNNKIEKLSSRITSFEKGRLKDHIVLIGMDGVNVAIAKDLKNRNTKFIVVTADKTVSDRLEVQGYKSFVADATSEIDMAQFELKKARYIVVDLKDNSRTVYALLVVRSLIDGTKVVVVAQNRETEEHIRKLGLFKNESIINPNDIAAANIKKGVPK